MRKGRSIKQKMMDNALYKLVAFVLTLVLWVTILGRKDSVMSRDINVEFLLSANHVVSLEKPLTVSVKVSGPRTALKKFSDIDESIVLDLRNRTAGIYTVEIPKSGSLELPLGVKVLSIQPNVVQARVVQQSLNKGD